MSSRKSWSSPSYHGLVGPNEVADSVISFRAWNAENHANDLAPPDESGIRSLLQLAFNLSLVTEEGSFLRPRLFVPRGGGWQPKPEIISELSVVFSNDPEGIDALRRISAICDSYDAALLVEQEGHGFRCYGLGSLSGGISSVQVGRGELNHHLQSPPGLSIRIDGPGSLRVTDMFHTFVLRRGRIYDSFDITYAPPIRELLYRIGVALTDGLDVPRYIGVDNRLHQNAIPTAFALSRIVVKMRDARKGGALIFPGLGADMHISYGLNGGSTKGLPDHLRAFYDATRLAANATSAESLRDALARWQNAHQLILRTTDAIASLSKVDGCVVMNESLTALSFGAKINALTQSPEARSIPQLVNPFTKHSESEDEIMRLGTRHRSAYALCQSCPGTTAIVVSQDGDIRLFASDDQFSYFVDALEASSIGLPTF